MTKNRDFWVMELGMVLYDVKKCADQESPNNHGLEMTIKGSKIGPKVEKSHFLTIWTPHISRTANN